MLTINLAPILKARGIERANYFLVKAGMSRHSAYNILYGRVRNVPLDHIEFLCEKLLCTPHDILEWTPDKNKTFAGEHPLANLKKETFSFNWQETLRTMPLEQISELSTLIKEKNNKNKS